MATIRGLTVCASREKSQQLKATLEQEQTKASVVLKDLRAKMLVEKAREVDLQKDALHKKFDLDMNKVVKQKDGDLAKVSENVGRIFYSVTCALRLGSSKSDL